MCLWKQFKSGHRTNIHHTKMGCLSSISILMQCSDVSDTTLDDQSQDNNQCAVEAHAPILKRVFLRRQKPLMWKSNSITSLRKRHLGRIVWKNCTKLSYNWEYYIFKNEPMRYGDKVYETCKDKTTLLMKKEKGNLRNTDGSIRLTH